MALEDGWLAAETGGLHFDGCKSKYTQSQAVSHR
jgi:frataxin-like iron-binding protein CyaY